MDVEPSLLTFDLTYLFERTLRSMDSKKPIDIGASAVRNTQFS